MHSWVQHPQSRSEFSGGTGARFDFGREENSRPRTRLFGGYRLRYSDLRHAAFQDRCDLAHLLHQFIELVGEQRLRAVGERLVRLGMHLDHQSVRANRYRRLSISAPPRDIKTEHRLIYEATIQRDAVTATTRLRDHFERTARMVDELLKNKW